MHHTKRAWNSLTSSKLILMTHLFKLSWKGQLVPNNSWISFYSFISFFPLYSQSPSWITASPWFLGPELSVTSSHSSSTVLGPGPHHSLPSRAHSGNSYWSINPPPHPAVTRPHKTQWWQHLVAEIKKKKNEKYNIHLKLIIDN